MIGPSIRFHMEATGVKQCELAEMLEIKHESQLSRILKPHSNPKWTTIIKASNALNVSVKTLVVTAQFLKDKANV